MSQSKPSLKALTAAALALPGLAEAQTQTDYLYARYDEGDIPAARAASGESESRYSIDTHMLRLARPMGESTVLGTLTYEAMSGASPWWVQPNANGEPVQVMSGASIEETRIDLQTAYAHESKDGVDWIASLGYSDEDDYSALSGGVELIYDLPETTLTISGGLQYSDDRLDPVQGRSSPDVVARADKQTLTSFAGVSWVASPRTVVQTALSLTWQDGFLSDPYKRAFVSANAGTVPDSRPGDRLQWALSAKARHYVAAADAALQVDYRYFFDDWEIRAHTLELGWQQSFADAWQWRPSVRWTSQSQAYFYSIFFDREREDGLASSDYRLSPFGALSARVDISKRFAQVQLGGGLEWYEADGQYAIESVGIENPGLVDYLTLNLRLAWLFE